MTEATTEEVKKSVIINASPEIVFRALTDETELTHGF